jgi:DNA-binding NtrC family response regulator
MIGDSPVFLDALRLIDRIARYDVPVLIEGESGTGKELAARAIHYRGRRRDRPFVPVNCGAIPDTLIENELFGHERGAFTDAREPQRGLISAAHTGTLFLDEVEALSAKAQVTLLRFLQDAQYRPLGSSRSEDADTRIISATNARLQDLAAHGAFRADLLYRLDIVHVTMPPLRDRVGDPALLAAHFVAKLSLHFGEPAKAVSPGTLEWFDQYPWPGNIRELENLICRSYVLTDGDMIHAAPLGTPRPSDTAEAPPDLPYAAARAHAIDAFEKRYLEALLTRAHGNVTVAASLAGKERRTLGKMLKKHQMDRTRFARGA